MHANEKLAGKLTRNFRENKKLFWKEVNEVRKPKSQMSMNVKDERGNIVNEKRGVLRRWSDYFEELLNVSDDREPVVAEHGIERGRTIEVEEHSISRGEIAVALHSLKNNKAPGIDQIGNEMLKKGGDSMLEWLERLFNACWREMIVPKEWQMACVVPLYKGKGDKMECKNYRGISLLSVVGKLYGRVIINRVKAQTDMQIGDEQGGFREGRGCVDQVFAIKQVCEKYLGKRNKEVHMAFMDLEKAYDRVDRNALWKVLGMYGIRGKLMGGIQAFYKDSKACVRVDREEGRWFSVQTGLRQGCVMSPWLFNIFMDGVTKEVRARTHGEGVELWNKEDRQKWGELSVLLFADDTVLLADSKLKLQRLVDEFAIVCDRRKLRINVEKSKVMKCTREREGGKLDIVLNGKLVEEVNNFKYLGVVISADGTMSEELESRMMQGRKLVGAMKAVWNARGMDAQAKLGMYEGIVEPTVLYGCEAWTLNVTEKRRLEAMEMTGLRAIAKVRRLDRISNRRVRERCGKSKSTLRRVEDGMLRWFGHIVRMDDSRLVKKVYNSEVIAGTRRGRPRRVWEGSVKDVLVGRNLNMRAATELAMERKEWRKMWRDWEE